MVPKEVIDYATKLGFTGQHEAGKLDGITYYQLYIKSRIRGDVPRKIGLPVLVRQKGESIERISGNDTLRMIRQLSIL